MVEIEFGDALVFAEGGKPENPVKNPWSKDEKQQQTRNSHIGPGARFSKDSVS